jgi:hypothetical protein
MQFKSWLNSSENIGHFRLSVSNDPAAIDREQKRLAMARMADPWQKLAAAYRLIGDKQAIDRLVERRPTLAAAIGDLFTQPPDENWQRAVEIYTAGLKAIEERMKDEGGRMKGKNTAAEGSGSSFPGSGSSFILHPSSLFYRRARDYEALKNWDAAGADWSRATKENPDAAGVLADSARRLAAAGRVPLAKAQVEKSEALYSRSLQADPENDIVAGELAQLLLDQQAFETAALWTVLKPTEFKSKGGATLTRLPDDSILASGRNPLGDAYTIVAATTAEEIRAIRLEALTDDSLPNQGPGRDAQRDLGSFAMDRFTITAEVQGTQPRLIQVSKSAADHSFLDLSRDHWNIGGGGSRPHTAVYLLEQPLDGKGGARLEFQMHFSASTEWPGQNLGRFRLSVSADPAQFVREQERFVVMKATDPWSRLAAAYAVSGRSDAASQYLGRALEEADGYESRKPILELAARFDEVLSALIKRRPDDGQLQLAWARNLAGRGQARLAEKQPAKAQADLEKSREVFTRLLAEHPEVRWTVLTPTEWKSQAGETLTVEGDGSIFVSGPNPNRAAYTLTQRIDQPAITAIRLETIPDARLPQGGAGRNGDGNFHLAELTAKLVSDAADGKATPIEFGAAIVDYENWGTSPSTLFDGNPRTYWDTYTKQQTPHWAIFILKSPARMDGRSLSITLDSGISDYGPQCLGRFRVSVTSDPELSRALARNDLKDSEVVDLNIALAKAHAQQSHTKEAVAAFAEALSLAADRAGKAKVIAEAATLEGVLGRLAERAAGDARIQAALARHYDEHGNTPLADAARAKARLMFEQKLAQETGKSEWAAELADLLLSPMDAKPTMAVPTSENEAVNWRFSTTQPPADWSSEAFDDSAWNTGPGSFGNGSAQGLVLRTEWKTPDIWLRRKFEWKPNPAVHTLVARMIYDDGFELFINGQQVLSRSDWTTRYDFYSVDAKAVGLLKPGTNTMAVHCSSILGSQYIDVGLLGLSSNPRVSEQRLAAARIADPWAKLAAAYHAIGDQPALDRLLAQHPAAASGIGDLYAGDRNWKQALAEYDKAIASGTKDARIFAARAEAREKLEQWALAAADWGSADLHASDKTIRYGNPALPALEHRAEIHRRLQQYDKMAADCNELLKPERLGNNPWIFIKRGEAYDQERQWQKARADYDRAINLSSSSERETFHFYRAVHFAAQGHWKQARDDLHQAYQKPTDYLDGSFPRAEWWAHRDAALISAIAGDVENYDRAVAVWYHKQSARTPDPDESKWTVLTMLLFPEMITSANRPRLLELAGKTDAYWRPRLTAAIQYRSGDLQKAAEFFDANDPGAPFLFIAAMTCKKLGKPDRAQQRLNEGYAWIQAQREKDRGAGVPRPNSWLDWATIVTLQYEASESLAEPGAVSDKLPGRAVGEAQFQAALAQHDAERGNAALADAARTKARGLFQERLAREPQNSVLAAELAQLLLDQAENADASRWTVLKPTEMKSEGGATLTLKDDGSILASGKNAVCDTYTVTARAGLDRIRGIRLEALPDASLPRGGPGRYPTTGNFTLHEIRAFSGTEPARLSALLATYDQFGEFPSTVDTKIDEKKWDVFPQSGRKHVAFFGADLNRALGDELKFVMYFSRGKFSGDNLGRFRLSVTGDPAILDREVKRFAAMKLVDPWAKLGSAYVQTGDVERAVELLAKSAEKGGIASLLESGLSIGAVLDSLQAGHPEQYATLLPRLASAAAAIGQIDQARTLYARLVKLQPRTGLWTERTEQLRPGVLAAWYFDHGPEPWRDAHECELSVTDGVLSVRRTGGDPYFSAPAGGPAGGKAVVLRYRTDQDFGIQLFWADGSGGLADDRHGDYPLLATSGTWREAILPFSTQGTLNLLRLDANSARDHPLELDSILLRQLEPGDVGSLPADKLLVTKLAAFSQAAGRTRESVLFLAKASADDPKDTLLSVKVAALQAWFGQDKALAATRQRILAFAKATSDAGVAEHAAKACSIRPSTDKPDLDAALALGRQGVELEQGGEWRPWRLLALGMAEYRSGNDAAAEKALLAAAEAVENTPERAPYVRGISAFYRAMSLFRQGKRDEARKLAMAAAATMKPLPADEQNPLPNTTAPWDDLILWLASKEAKAIIPFEAPPASPVQTNSKPPP